MKLAGYANEQYEFIKESRNVLFKYCSTIPDNDFLCENSSFGRGGSIRNLLVHIANTYEFWIAKCGLNKDIVFTPYDSMRNIKDVIVLFDDVNAFMQEFIEQLTHPHFTQVSYEIGETKGSDTPFRLFSHVITHEFHHKGQILSISRHLGYVPVDTDIMR